jgi:APA family basic amino acid/polyamine antiporter
MQFLELTGCNCLLQVFGNYAVLIMALSLYNFGCNGLILAGARVYYAMAEDRIFIKGRNTLITMSSATG